MTAKRSKPSLKRTAKTPTGPNVVPFPPLKLAVDNTRRRRQIMRKVLLTAAEALTEYEAGGEEVIGVMVLPIVETGDGVRHPIIHSGLSDPEMVFTLTAVKHDLLNRE